MSTPSRGSRVTRLELAAEAKREAALNAIEQADPLKLTEPDSTLSIRINSLSLLITSEAEIPRDSAAAAAQAQ